MTNKTQDPNLSNTETEPKDGIKVTNTPKTDAAADAKKQKEKKILKMMMIIGAVFIILLTVVVFVILSNKNKEQAKQEAIAAEEAAQASLVEQAPQAPQLSESTYVFDASYLDYIDQKHTQNPNYWAVVHPVIDETGATVDSDPLRMLANQSIEEMIKEHKDYQGQEVRIPDTTETISLTDPNVIAYYNSEVAKFEASLREAISVRTEEGIINQGTAKAKIAVVSRDVGGQIEDIATAEQLQRFEQEILQKATNKVAEIIATIQSMKPVQQETDTGESDKVAQLEKDKAELQAAINTLNVNLEAARLDSLNKSALVNDLQQQMVTQNQRMAQFLNELERQPKINEKLQMSNLAREMPDVKTTAVVGDRVYLEDKNGKTYNVRVGDIVIVEGGKRLLLVDAENQTVVIE